MGHMHESLKGRGTEEHLDKGSLGKKMIGELSLAVMCMCACDVKIRLATQTPRKAGR